jgi:thioredoxin-dependent peroxiredoxin
MEKTMLQVGTTAPVFELPDASMEMIRLSSFRGKKNVVLYFYPRDGTPVCTREAIDFSDHEDDFGECDTIVMGVSRDDCLVHEEFCDKHGISVRLLSDMDSEVSRKYEVLKEQAVNGNVYSGVQRCTFIIDKKGVMRHILPDMNPRGHVAEVLKIVRQIHGH